MLEERVHSHDRIEAKIAAQIAGYRRGLTTASVAAAAVIWLAALALNGYFTVLVLGRMLGWSMAVCLAVQVIASLIEIGLWRSELRILYPLILLIGILDVLTSAMGLLLWFGGTGLSWVSVATIIAMGIALAPEPLLTIIAIWFLLLYHKRR